MCIFLSLAAAPFGDFTMKDRQTSLLKSCLILVFCVLIGACTSMKPMPDDAVGLTEVSSCNIVEHMRCIYLTGKETVNDGLERKWTRHWFRMSYIGKACERQHGRTTAVILESLFALPHYFFIAIGNAAAAISPFAKKDHPAQAPSE